MNAKGLLSGLQALERLSRVPGDPPISLVGHPSSHEVVFSARDREHFVLILVEDLNKPVMNAIRYARLLSGETVAIHVQINPSDRERIEERWKDRGIDVPLVVLDSADGSIIRPLTVFIDGIRKRQKRSLFIFLLPELIDLKWWQRFLHNQTARLIERAFQGDDGVVTIRVPFPLTGS